MKNPLLKIRNLSKHFLLKKHLLKAVDNLSFDIFPGEVLGLVGESGCGKSTLAKMLLRLLPPTQGKIFFSEPSTPRSFHRDIDLLSLKKKDSISFRKSFQMVFQDPSSSLNTRMTVEQILKEPLLVHKIGTSREQKKKIEELLYLVGLSPLLKSRFPHEFSGGQRQRIGIARALATDPIFLICDEPISSLDVSIQSQIVNLLKELQTKFHLTLLFIAHDLSIVKYISDRTAVMYLGKFVEIGQSEELYKKPLHPYTQALLNTAFSLDNQKRKPLLLEGEVNPLLAQTKGCPFAPRCPKKTKRCLEEIPEWKEIHHNHCVSCHLYG